MHRILLDNNVIIDIIQETRPLHKVASLIMDDITTGKYEGVIASKSVSDVSYIYIQDAEHRHPDETRRERAKRIRSLIHDLVVVLDVAPITKENILDAIDSSVDDLEDAIIASAAETASADLIITIFAKINLSHPTRKRQEKTEPLGKNLVYNERKGYTGGKRSGNISGDLRRNQAVSGDIRVRAAANSAAVEDIEEYRQKVLGRNNGAVGTQARQRSQKRCSDR